MLHLHIGNKNYSSWSMRPWVLLRHFGMPFTEVMHRFDSFDAGSHFKQSLSPLTPVGKVPLLVHGDLVVWDTLAIAEYLAEYADEHFPEHALWPRDQSARARARSLCAEMHSGFAALRSACPMNIEASLPAVGAQLLADAAGGGRRPGAHPQHVASRAGRQRRALPVRQLRHGRCLLRPGGRPPAQLCACRCRPRWPPTCSVSGPARAWRPGCGRHWTSRNFWRSKSRTGKRADSVCG